MKKKIIIIIVVILLCLVGSLFYLFAFTDIFKSDSQLFWKYLSEGKDATEIYDNDTIEKINNERLSKSYIKNSQIQIKQNDDVYTVSVNTNAWNSNNVYSDVSLDKNSNEVAKFKLVKKSNVVGIKMDELANGYISVKSNRLKEITNMLGLQDSEGLVPNNINVFTGFDVGSLSKEDKEYLITKYGKMIQDKTESRNYQKLDESKIKIDDRFYKVEGYQLSLTENETKEILSSIFDELSKDSRSLNIISTKLKVMNVPEKYASINALSDRFANLSEEINSMETTDAEYLRVIAYVNEKKLLLVNLEYSDGNKISIDYSKENNILKIEQINEESNENKHFKFFETISKKASSLFDSVSEIVVNINSSNEQSEIVSNVNIKFKDEKTISYKSSIRITDDVAINENYDTSKKIVLNDLNQQQLQQIYKLIKNNIEEIYKEKIDVLNVQSNDNVQEENQ